MRWFFASCAETYGMTGFLTRESSKTFFATTKFRKFSSRISTETRAYIRDLKPMEVLRAASEFYEGVDMFLHALTQLMTHSSSLNAILRQWDAKTVRS
jgi:hypothetical protein